MKEDILLKEYFEIFQAVREFDKNLLTVKGWGVTLSLAALAWGFQYDHYGLFLVAMCSGIGFWLIEGSMKRHQMRYYFRMREIEIIQYKATGEGDRHNSSPRIDSGWSHAGAFYKGEKKAQYRPLLPTELKKKSRLSRSYRYAWGFPHVFLPHLVSVLVGLVLLVLGGWYKFLGDKMTW